MLNDSPKGAFQDAVLDLLYGLYPLYEREEPSTLGPETASYCGEPLYDTSRTAIEAGLVVLDLLENREEEPQWVRLYHATVVASAIIGDSGPDAPLAPLKSAYQVLNAAHEATYVPAASTALPMPDGSVSHRELLERLHRHLPPPDSIDGRGYRSAAFVAVHLADTPLRPGDFLLHSWNLGKSYRRRLVKGASILHLPRSNFERVYSDVVDPDPVLTYLHDPGSLAGYLKRATGRGKRDSTSPLLIVRPLVSPVSEPIQASTDDAAIFKLLGQVGGRMPRA